MLSSSDEEDPWWVPVFRAKRPRRIAQLSSDEDENRSIGDRRRRRRDSGSDAGSNSTEVVGGDLQKEERDENSSVDKDKPKPRSVTLEDEEDNEDVELLSISSGDSSDEKEKLNSVSDEDLVDSDETCFEPPPSPVPTTSSRIRSAKNRPGSPSSSRREHLYSANDNPKATARNTSASDSEDPTFHPAGDSSETDYSDDEDDDFKKPATKKSSSNKSTPLRPHSTANLPRVELLGSSEDEDPIPLPMRDRPPPKLQQYWVDPDEEYTATPTYDPSSARTEDWHGDVQRTITMFDQTIAGMPMPSDDGIEDIKLPPGLVQLYPHQTYALRWMSWREGQFPGGGILADEMGLGKTIEVIALIMKSKWDATKVGNENMVSTSEAGRCVPSRTNLVVCPLGCIPQWVREIETKGKNLKVCTYHGAKKPTSAVELAKYDVVITTYQTIANEIPKQTDPPRRCRSPLKRVYWVRIVLDEAHQVRNPKTKAAQAIFQLEARHRWAVTGTPIHNRPEDFYSMCTFLRLSPFDDRGVWDMFIGLRTIKRGAEKRLHILGKALILRRTKDEVGLSTDGSVKHIPPKTVDVVSVELSEEERKVYDMLMDYAQTILRKFLSQKEQREHGLHIGGLMYAGNRLQEQREQCPEDIKFSHIFALLIRLRQCAVLPHLIETMLQQEELDGEVFDELKPEHIVSKRNPVFDRLYLSSKFQKILEDIEELRRKAKDSGQPMDKVIIVSSWTSTLDLIHEHLLEKNYSCVFITGRDDMNIRMDNMDRFNKNKWRPQIMLLSLMAGGVGLNLVGANHVFFIEPHWNPQHELQAQDRVHRFGQTKDVFIRRYIAEDTIESRIMDLQQQKRELADGLLSNTKKKRGAGITLEQMKHLFDLNNHRAADEFDI